MLYGGRSSEREVSLKTGEACAEALRTKGYDVTLVDVDLDVARAAARGAGRGRPSSRSTAATARTAASRGCSSRWASPTPARACSPPRVGHGQGVLQAASSGPRPLDRRRTGSSRASGRLDRAGSTCPSAFPVVVKPAGEGSSVGVHIVKDAGRAGRAPCVDAARLQGRRHRGAVRQGQRGPGGGARRQGARRHRDRPGPRVLRLRRQVHRRHHPVLLPGPHLPAPHARARLRAPPRWPTARLGCAGVTRTDFIVTDDGDALHPRGEHAARA